MPRTGLSADELREKAIGITLEKVRRDGFGKLHLTEVARELDISHAALYAHFTCKAALKDAVKARWFAEAEAMLTAEAQGAGAPRDRIERWFLRRYAMISERAALDAELYRTFDAATARRSPVVAGYLERLRDQLADLLVEAGLGGAEPAAAADFLLDAMAAFHHPKLVVETIGEDRTPRLRRILAHVLDGMSREAGQATPSPTGVGRFAASA
ncbi:TetR family transcriptional regulator [Allosediminivita pacifica]|uniref:TetR family transcriptional regulator n=1 Tax=Allosediminivita pacifica TaxID=1267769 RepID=A0A2T6ASW0_9RHOB|nr:TetR family transcriptional regulator [Allosediminivita pacifica]PTX46905.1 TetR family transcriptional regulator [Allosediminivita pacifica]GGB15328.1 hypothetical protein GCM10011324_26900 [Allosediminivita pacifica]